jgi:hypothetical protein
MRKLLIIMHIIKNINNDNKMDPKSNKRNVEEIELDEDEIEIDEEDQDVGRADIPPNFDSKLKVDVNPSLSKTFTNGVNPIAKQTNGQQCPEQKVYFNVRNENNQDGLTNHYHNGKNGSLNHKQQQQQQQPDQTRHLTQNVIDRINYENLLHLYPNATLDYSRLYVNEHYSLTNKWVESRQMYTELAFNIQNLDHFDYNQQNNSFQSPNLITFAKYILGKFEYDTHYTHLNMYLINPTLKNILQNDKKDHSNRNITEIKNISNIKLSISPFIEALTQIITFLHNYSEKSCISKCSLVVCAYSKDNINLPVLVRQY